MKQEKYISYLFCAITGGVLIAQGFVHILSWLIFHRLVVGPRIFATLREILWYSCSPVCGLSARWLCGGAHMPCPLGLLQPEPVPHGRTLLTHGSTGDTHTFKGSSGSISWGPWVLVNTRFCLSPPSLSGGYGV